MMQIFSIILAFLLFSHTGAAKTGIVHGKESKPHSRPYMASLQFQGRHSCGGILIREDFVLTAAHCRYDQPMTVVLGAHNLDKKEKSQQRIPVIEYHKHPKYTGRYDYDIMLLKLENNAVLNKYVKVIGLPKKNGNVPGRVTCVVAGWGRTGAQKPFSNVLKETTEMTQFSFECKQLWKEYFMSTHMICTKFDRKMGGVCQGDSGGPLICNSKPQGLTVFTAQKCDDPTLPHVFTKLHFFLPWIKKIMQGNGNVV